MSKSPVQPQSDEDRGLSILHPDLTASNPRTDLEETRGLAKLMKELGGGKIMETIHQSGFRITPSTSFMPHDPDQPKSTDDTE